MEMKDNVAVVAASSRKLWRAWLAENHKSYKSIWLIIYHKKSEQPSVTYDEAVDEALCFGWIDSKPNKRDHESYYQFFSKRNPKSNWSKKNKEKIAYLLKENLIAESGHAMIDLAKKTGTWNALDEVEQLIIPSDLQTAFDQNKTAWTYFQDFPPSTKRGILEWIFNAKRAATRAKRIKTTVDMASENKRANQYRQ